MNTSNLIGYNKKNEEVEDMEHQPIPMKRNSIKNIRHQINNQGSFFLHKKRYLICEKRPLGK
jgi:hypothetical protein